jgi:hypothetical protein
MMADGRTNFDLGRFTLKVYHDEELEKFSDAGCGPDVSIDVSIKSSHNDDDIVLAIECQGSLGEDNVVALISALTEALSAKAHLYPK